MTVTRSQEYLAGLIRELINSPHETEWIEFKTNNDNPVEIGEYISALSNGAALCGKTSAYLIWGVEDKVTTSLALNFFLFLLKLAMKNWRIGCLNLLTLKFNFVSLKPS